MIQSMTGFARSEFKADWGTLTWELRSVNQRFLESFFRLPDAFRALEPKLKEHLKKHMQRGKVECQLRFSQDNITSAGVHVDQELAQAVLKAADWVQSHSQSSGINPMDILRWPGVVSNQSIDLEQVTSEVISSYEHALEQLVTARQTEGQSLALLLSERLVSIEQQAEKVKAHMPEVLAWQKQRINEKFTEAKLELDPSRLEQEMILIAQKADVAEEIDRLNTHITETRKILKKGGAIGRRLDFMMQEFNRETNTIASKSINTEITQSAVEMKVLIEQMREQIQNIE